MLQKNQAKQITTKKKKSSTLLKGKRQSSDSLKYKIVSAQHLIKTYYIIRHESM